MGYIVFYVVEEEISLFKELDFDGKLMLFCIIELGDVSICYDK